MIIIFIIIIIIIIIISIIIIIECLKGVKKYNINKIMPINYLV